MPKDITHVPDSPDVERIERFHALEPGTYWRAKKSVKIPHPRWEGHFNSIDKGTVLLLLSIECFDGKQHTAVLRYHPIDGEGSYRLLVDDFLNKFDLAPDAEQVRVRELATLQKEIADIQTELSQAQANPTLMTPEVDPELNKWEQGEKTGRKSKSKALIAPGASIRTDIALVVEKRLTPAQTHELRHIAAREAKRAELQAEWIEQRTSAITEKLKAMAPFFVEKSDVALARTSGMRQIAEDIMKGIESLDLYTGKGVEVHALAKGKPAPPNEPLTLMQRKLFMDEEFAAWADVGAEFDFREIDDFDKAIKKNPALRDQLLPAPRCVTSMAVRRDALDYGDTWVNHSHNEVNLSVFLLVRNGENIYRVHSAQPSHEHTPRLFPTRGEFDRLFRGIDGKTITFRDVQFTKRTGMAEDHALHYKRFLILLCGLDHRLRLFGTFYDNSAPSFISLEFQNRFMRFLADDERHTLLGEGRLPVDEWIDGKNAYLRSGSRVLCYYDDLLTVKTAPGCMVNVPNRRGDDWTESRAKPNVKFETLISYRNASHLCAEVEVEREYRRLRGDTRRPTFKARVDLTVALKENDDAIGFLCLDAVRAEELEWYVHDRESRIGHVGYIRMFKAAAESLRREEVAEAPTRAWLHKALLETGLATTANVGQMTDESVRAWRCANRGCALPGLEDKSAFKAILNHADHLHRRLDDTIVRVERFITEKGIPPLRLSLTGRDRLALYAEVPATECDNALMPWRWVRRIVLEKTQKGVSARSERFTWMLDKADASETALKEWDGCRAWLNEKAEPFRPDAIKKAQELVTGSYDEVRKLFVAKGAGIDDKKFTDMTMEMARAMRSGRGKLVAHSQLSVPIGAFVEHGKERARLGYLVLRGGTEYWLKHFANPEQRARLEEMYASIYAKPENARERLRSHEFSPDLAALYHTPSSYFDFSDKTETPKHLRDASGYYKKSRSYSSSWIEYGLNQTLQHWVSARGEKNDVIAGFILHPMIFHGKEAALEEAFCV